MNSTPRGIAATSESNAAPIPNVRLQLVSSIPQDAEPGRVCPKTSIVVNTPAPTTTPDAKGSVTTAAQGAREENEKRPPNAAVRRRLPPLTIAHMASQ